MILCPLQNVNDVRPLITQPFGVNKDFYKQFNLNGHQLQGHEGIDIRAQIGTPVHSPIEGVCEVVDSGPTAYGLHVNIINDRFKIVLAHLSSVSVKSGDFIPLGNPIGLSGDSGSAKGSPHLHLTVMKVQDGKVLNTDNGFGGAIDVSPYIITWQGTLTSNTL